MLGMHSKVNSASKEMHFFDIDENYENGYSWYQQKMPSCQNSEITIEKSPSYFFTRKVHSRVFRFNKDIKLLLIVREPVTRLISDYTQLLHKHVADNFTFMSFEEFVRMEMGGDKDEENSIHIYNNAMTRSIYAKQMKKWMRYFPLSQIHVIDGERLINKPWEEIGRVENFLMLEHEIEKSNFYYNNTKGFYCLKTKGCLRESKERQHPDVSAELLHKLRIFFAPYNNQFYDLIGQNFGWPEE